MTTATRPAGFSAPADIDLLITGLERQLQEARDQNRSLQAERSRDQETIRQLSATVSNLAQISTLQQQSAAAQPAPTGRRYRLICEECIHTIELSPEKFSTFEQGGGFDISGHDPGYSVTRAACTNCYQNIQFMGSLEEGVRTKRIFKVIS